MATKAVDEAIQVLLNASSHAWATTSIQWNDSQTFQVDKIAKRMALHQQITYTAKDLARGRTVDVVGIEHGICEILRPTHTEEPQIQESHERKILLRSMKPQSLIFLLLAYNANEILTTLSMPEFWTLALDLDAYLDLWKPVRERLAADAVYDVVKSIKSRRDTSEGDTAIDDFCAG